MFGERSARLAGNGARVFLILLMLWVGVTALPGTLGGSGEVQAAVPQVATSQRQSPLPTREVSELSAQGLKWSIFSYPTSVN